MRLQHFNYFGWDSERSRIIFREIFRSYFFCVFTPGVSREGEREVQKEYLLQHWTSGWSRWRQMTQDWHDLLMWCTLVHTKMRSGRSDGYFQSQFRVPRCQCTKRWVDKHMIQSNGKKLFRRWRIRNDQGDTHNTFRNTWWWWQCCVKWWQVLRGTLRCSGSNVGCVVKISEETEKETEEPEDPDEVTEDPDEVRELLYTRLDWLRMWKKLLQ